jgi:hypothetical protein
MAQAKILSFVGNSFGLLGGICF